MIEQDIWYCPECGSVVTAPVVRTYATNTICHHEKKSYSMIKIRKDKPTKSPGLSRKEKGEGTKLIKEIAEKINREGGNAKYTNQCLTLHDTPTLEIRICLI